MLDQRRDGIDLGFASCQQRMPVAAALSVRMESTQWMNNAELVNSMPTIIEQLQQQIQMYLNMYQNTLGIPIQAWNSIVSRLNSLVSTIQNTQGIVNATVMPSPICKRPTAMAICSRTSSKIW
jgi:P-type conjugative transfer protein TrbJ